MKLGSLFDGSGGFPMAGVINGIEPVWASEIEPYPLKVTAARFQHVKQLGDVTKINGAEVEPVLYKKLKKARIALAFAESKPGNDEERDGQHTAQDRCAGVDQRAGAGGGRIMPFWCKGKKDYCQDSSSEACNDCKYEDGSGGIELDDDDVFIGQWISVEDRLPEPNQKVLAYRADSKGTYEEYRLCFGWALKGAITHWMPLPEPPKET